MVDSEVHRVTTPGTRKLAISSFRQLLNLGFHSMAPICQAIMAYNTASNSKGQYEEERGKRRKKETTSLLVFGEPRALNLDPLG
jgi:hypothetical protein